MVNLRWYLACGLMERGKGRRGRKGRGKGSRERISIPYFLAGA
jgi:hypothetical protein